MSTNCADHGCFQLPKSRCKPWFIELEYARKAAVRKDNEIKIYIQKQNQGEILSI
jgi:hypothetical protein